jgi:hypothetical protein
MVVQLVVLKAGLMVSSLVVLLAAYLEKMKAVSMELQ